MRTLELCAGLGLLLGPLAYALTLQPEVVEVVEVIEVVAPPASVEPGTETCSEPVEVVTEPVRPYPAQDAPELEPAPAPAPAPTVEGRIALAFANEAGLVLSVEADPAWGTGRLREHPGPGQFRAAKRADATRVPAALWAERGRTFDVYGASGKLCTARLGELSVLVQHDGPSLYDVFGGSMDDESYAAFEQQEHTAKEIRAKVWSHGTPESGAWLVAELVSEGSCHGALWARDAELPPPVVLHRSDAPSSITERRIAEHEASTALAELKVAHAQWLAEVPAEDREHHQDWAAIEREHPATAHAWLDAAGTARLVALDFGYTEEGCGDFPETSIASLDLVEGEGFVPTPHATDPAAIFDADLDGRWELHYGDTIVSETPELAAMWSIDEQFYCPC